jgi:palmitoyl-protein thioesterase
MDLCHGVHMQIDPACQMKVFGKYVGIAPPSSLLPSTVRHGWAQVMYTLTGLRMAATPSTLQLLLFLSTLLLLQAIFTAARSFIQKRQQGRVRLV